MVNNLESLNIAEISENMNQSGCSGGVFFPLKRIKVDISNKWADNSLLRTVCSRCKSRNAYKKSFLGYI
jgi:hypothetical protein